MNITRIVFYAFILITVYVLLKKYSPDIAILVATVGTVTVFVYAIGSAAPYVNAIREELSRLGVGTQYVSVAVRSLGIVCITKFCADICHDAGSTALESKVNFAGKCAVFINAVPLVLNVFSAVSGLLKQ